MRYAVYAVLVMVGCGGLLAGVNGLSSRAPGDSFEGISWLLIGSVALGSIAVVMAIEHATSVQTRTLRDFIRYQQQRDKPRLAASGPAEGRSHEELP